MILVTGSLAYDQIMDFPGEFRDHIHADKLHILNVSFLVNKLRKGFGGTAGNIAYTLSLLGITSEIMGTVGDDFSPYRIFLKKHHIGTKFLKIIKSEKTSSAFGITDKKDNQIWGFYTGADKFSHNLSISKIKDPIDMAVIAPQNPKAMLKFAVEYSHKKIPYLFDPGMQLPWFEKSSLLKAITGAKIIIGNDYEIRVMEKKTGIGNLHSIAGKNKIIITTLGDQGSVISYAKDKIKIKAAKTERVVDPSGAGDSYRAGFLAGFLRHFDLIVCGQMGSMAACYAVEKYGTSNHRFTLKEFSRRLKENYGLSKASG